MGCAGTSETSKRYWVRFSAHMSGRGSSLKSSFQVKDTDSEEEYPIDVGNIWKVAS